MPFTTFWSI